MVNFDSNEGPNSVLSGFTITGGVTTVDGSAIFCDGTSPTIWRNVVAGNQAMNGAGIYCQGNAAPVIEQNVFRDNYADNNGGGVFTLNSPAELVNNLIVNNRAGIHGGGLYVRGDSVPTICNNTLAGNLAPQGSGIYRYSGDITVSNCIIWNDGEDLGNFSTGDTVEYSCVEDFDLSDIGTVVSVIHDDPRFVDRRAGSFYILPDSPCVDSGLATCCPADDIDCTARSDGQCDMGAAEVLDCPGGWTLWVTSAVRSEVEITVDDGQDVTTQVTHFSRCFSTGTQVTLTTPETDGHNDFVCWVLNGVSQEPEVHNLVVTMNADQVARAHFRTVWTVGEDVSDNYQTIQAALDDVAVQDDDEVVVAEGLYQEMLDFGGKQILLRSEDPLDRDTVARTIIQGDGTDSVVTFNNDEGPRAELAGFTITGGGNSNGGGIFCSGSSPVIRHNVIRHNRLLDNDYGGGIYCVDSVSRIVGNSIVENWVAGSTNDGGGLYLTNSPVVLLNNVIARNRAEDLGGGIFISGLEPRIRNNTIVDNEAGDPSADNGGGISANFDMTISNCIVWGNGDDLRNVTAEFSIIEDLGDPGPLFVDRQSGCYHLSPGSPAINGGDPITITILDETDIDGEPRIQNGLIDMGADEVDPTACGTMLWVTSNPGELSIMVTPLDLNGDGDGDHTSFVRCYDNGTPVTLEASAVVGPHSFVRWVLDGADQPEGQTTLDITLAAAHHTARAEYETVWTVCPGLDQFGTIQAAIDWPEVKAGQTIELCSDTTYSEMIDFKGKAVTIRSIDPDDWSVVQGTVIQGDGSDPVVTFNTVEGPGSVLAGVTVTGGRGGIRCDGVSPTIRNCYITGNVSNNDGGGITCLLSSPLIHNNRIEANETTGTGDNGGGIYAAYSANNDYGPMIIDNEIVGNRAYRGGGIHIYGSVSDPGDLLVRNNTIVGNEATEYEPGAGEDGDGVYCHSNIENVVLSNNVMWDNPPDAIMGQEGDWYFDAGSDRPRFEYSCIEQDVAEDDNWTGVIHGNPLFVDSDGADNDPSSFDDNDYHLALGSPAVDGGDPTTIVFSGEVDIDGEPRIYNSVRIDIGADEQTPLDFFIECMAGPGITEPPPGCDPAEFAASDKDGDGDVDIKDFDLFQAASSGR